MFGEIILQILYFLFEATVWICLAMIRPFRFLCSKKYREQTQEEWKTSKFQKFIDIFSSSVATILFVTAMWFWISVFSVSEKPKKDIPPSHVTTRQDQTNESNTTYKITMHINVEEAKQKLKELSEKMKEKE